MPLDPVKIKSLMGARTQREIASLAGMTQGNMSMLLAGKRRVSLVLLERLARALDCKVEDLLTAVEHVK